MAQESGPIVTDRPTQSAAASTVGKSRFLIETGFIFENTNEFSDYLNFNTLIRYGISDRVEVRLLANYDRTDGDDFIVSSIGSTGIGTKVFLVDNENAFADISVIGQINLPTGDENDEATGEIRFNFANTLSSEFSLGYNLGFFVSPDRENEVSPFYSIVLGVAIVERLTAFVEPYGFLNEPTDHRINAGLIYLLNNRFQLDISGGLGLAENSPESFVGFGVALGF